MMYHHMCREQHARQIHSILLVRKFPFFLLLWQKKKKMKSIKINMCELCEYYEQRTWHTCSCSNECVVCNGAKKKKQIHDLHLHGETMATTTTSTKQIVIILSRNLCLARLFFFFFQLILFRIENSFTRIGISVVPFVHNSHIHNNKQNMFGSRVARRKRKKERKKMYEI